MKKMQQFCVFLLVLCMTVSMLPAAALAKELDTGAVMEVTEGASETDTTEPSSKPEDAETPKEETSSDAGSASEDEGDGREAEGAEAPEDSDVSEDEEADQKEQRADVGLMTLAVQPEEKLTAQLQAASTAADLSKGDAVDGTSYLVTSRKNYSIAPDIRESVIITNTAAGDSQTVANVMEISVANGYAKLAAGYGNRNPAQDGWKMATTTNQVHLYENTMGKMWWAPSTHPCSTSPAANPWVIW